MSEKIRSEILETGNEQIKSARIVINAPAEKIFAVLSNPHRHKEIDGSATIQENISGPDKLVLGSKFGMKMHLGVDYRIRNTVVEYSENSLIAWRHVGRWIWRYELVNMGLNLTQVTETFDASCAPLISKAWLSLRKAYPWTQKAVAKTLVQLKSTCEG
jgi:Polyketide cyclase / dehydrase and lipid transport